MRFLEQSSLFNSGFVFAFEHRVFMMLPSLSWACGTPPDPASPVLGLQEHTILGSLSSSRCSVQRVELRDSS